MHESSLACFGCSDWLPHLSVDFLPGLGRESNPQVIALFSQHFLIVATVTAANFMMRPALSKPWEALDAGRLRSPWLMAIDFGCSQPANKARAFIRRTGTPVSLQPKAWSLCPIPQASQQT